MARRATATFKIDSWDENEIMETGDGSRVTHAKVSRSFAGNIAGTGTVESLTGPHEGRRAAFVVRHIGAFDGLVTEAELRVVPGSGTGELSGLRGEASFVAGLGPEGERHVTLHVDT
jgi:Protein of unknown function (DUF3224)